MIAWRKTIWNLLIIKSERRLLIERKSNRYSMTEGPKDLSQLIVKNPAGFQLPTYNNWTKKTEGPWTMISEAVPPECPKSLAFQKEKTPIHKWHPRDRHQLRFSPRSMKTKSGQPFRSSILSFITRNKNNRSWETPKGKDLSDKS